MVPTEAPGCVLSAGWEGKTGILDRRSDHARFLLGLEI